MSKKKPPRATSSATARKELERLDRDLVKLLSDRARTAQKVAEARQAEGAPVFDPEEELEAGRRINELNKGPLDHTALTHIYREILGASRGLVKQVRVAYLGPKYSYSHLAAISRFGTTAELVPVATIKAAFEELYLKQSEFGVVPIENSTDGRIVDTLDMFARLPLRICGEVSQRIHHNLLGKCPRSEVVEVYSKTQALSQCREWLSKHLPGVKTIEVTSTALAAEIASSKHGAAAVASLEAGMHYGLNVIDAQIEDNKNNVTRFAIIGGQPPKRTGRDKTALMLEIPHKPGSLADAMLIFKRGRLNMTWIESFPMPGSKNEYLFFVEIEGHQEDSRVKKALEALRRRTVRLEVLGSYPRAELVE
jgi:chorismate mutase/prephenate dehydratase